MKLQGFDGMLFQGERKIIEIHNEYRYIQLIGENNPSAWVWKTVNIPKGMTLEDENIVSIVEELIKTIVDEHPQYIVGHWLFRLKNGIDMYKAGVELSDLDLDLLSEHLRERIISDVEGEARQSYDEGFSQDWFSDKAVCECNIDRLQDECYDDYQKGDEETEDYQNAFEEISEKWISYTNAGPGGTLAPVLKELEKIWGRPCDHDHVDWSTLRENDGFMNVDCKDCGNVGAIRVIPTEITWSDT